MSTINKFAGLLSARLPSKIPWPISSKILLCVLVAATSAIMACASFATGGGLHSLSSPHKVLIGPAHLKGGLVQLERHPGNATARLRIVTHTVWTDYRDLDQMLTIFKKSLGRKQPLLLIWDVRSLTFPRVKMQQARQPAIELSDLAL